MDAPHPRDLAEAVSLLKAKDAQIAALKEQLRQAKASEIKGVAPRSFGEPQRYRLVVPEVVS
jgi:hypothetical protein